MQKIKADGTRLILFTWCIYVIAVMVFIWLSSQGIEGGDLYEIDKAFWARIYAAYSFPLFVLVLWILSGLSYKPASTIWLMSLAVLGFIVIFSGAHLFKVA